MNTKIKAGDLVHWSIMSMQGMVMSIEGNKANVFFFRHGKTVPIKKKALKHLKGGKQ